MFDLFWPLSGPQRAMATGLNGFCTWHSDDFFAYAWKYANSWNIPTHEKSDLVP